MGVKLGDLVVREPIKWDDLKNKKLAIDAFNVLFQFLSSIRQRDGTQLMDSHGQTTSHLVGTFSRVTNLLSQSIYPIFVFDGKPPHLKEKVREQRLKVKTKAEGLYKTALEEGNRENMGRYARQLSFLNETIIEETKELLHALGLPTVQAPSEAEAQCAYMCKKGIVWATASQDYDTLLFGSPRLIQNLTLSHTRKLSGGKIIYISPTLIDLTKTLKTLHISQERLIALAILTGTDYNPGGVSLIGPKKALALVQKDIPLEQIFQEAKAEFDWKEVMETFTTIPTIDVSFQFSSCNPAKLYDLLVKRHDFSHERVEKTIATIMKNEKGTLSRWL